MIETLQNLNDEWVDAGWSDELLEIAENAYQTGGYILSIEFSNQYGLTKDGQLIVFKNLLKVTEFLKSHIHQEDLNCPHCGTEHFDIDNWALDAHRTHLCLNCNELFKGSLRGVSRPTFQFAKKPKNIIYVNKDNQFC